MKRIPNEDASILRYSGLMGHRFTCVFGPKTDRKKRGESDDRQGAFEMFYDGDQDPVVYEKVGKGKWKVASLFERTVAS